MFTERPGFSARQSLASKTPLALGGTVILGLSHHVLIHLLITWDAKRDESVKRIAIAHGSQNNRQLAASMESGI